MKSYVAVEVCFLCGKTTDAIILHRRLKEVFDKEVCTGNLCDSCAEIVKNNTMLICDCGAIIVVRSGAYPDWKPGTKFRVEKCPNCSPTSETEQPAKD